MEQVSLYFRTINFNLGLMSPGKVAAVSQIIPYTIQVVPLLTHSPHPREGEREGERGGEREKEGGREREKGGRI